MTNLADQGPIPASLPTPDIANLDSDSHRIVSSIREDDAEAIIPFVNFLVTTPIPEFVDMALYDLGGFIFSVGGNFLKLGEDKYIVRILRDRAYHVEEVVGSVGRGKVLVRF